jgi:transposase InsO family protein
MFNRVCHEHSIEHRFTQPNHPWTNGQVERMNRSLKEATVRRYHYDTHRQLEEHLAVFLDAYNFDQAIEDPYAASHPMRLSATYGQTSQSDSSTIRAIRD